MNSIPPQAFGWLAGSFIVALLVDFAVVRLLLEVLKPTSAYVFWIGRAGKLAGLIAWVLFFNQLFYVPYLAGVEKAVPMAINLTEWAVIGVIAVVAVATHPKKPRMGS